MGRRNDLKEGIPICSSRYRLRREAWQLIDNKLKRTLISQARYATKKAYSPYSNNKVGVALLTSKGNIYIGANIGNACSSLNCCAEQIAIAGAVMNKDMKFIAMALFQSPGGYCLPCGRCLQLMSEFASEMSILTAKGRIIKEYELRRLLPFPYKRPG